MRYAIIPSKVLLVMLEANILVIKPKIEFSLGPLWLTLFQVVYSLKVPCLKWDMTSAFKSVGVIAMTTSAFKSVGVIASFSNAMLISDSNNSFIIKVNDVLQEMIKNFLNFSQHRKLLWTWYFQNTILIIFYQLCTFFCIFHS